MRKATGRTGADIAVQGGISKQTFSGYLNTGRLPSAAVLANWVFRLGISANWLLTGKGPVMLEPAGGVMDPVVQRVATVVRSMREAGAEEADILRSVQAMLTGELNKLEPAPMHEPANEPANEAGQDLLSVLDADLNQTALVE